jgi:hypothetical protein
METKKTIGTDLRNKMSALQAQFKSAIQSFEQENLDASLQTARQIVETTSRMIDELADDYRHALLSHKLPQFERDRRFLEQFKPNGDKNAEMSKYMEFLVSLDQTIATLDREVKRNYPREPRLALFVQKNKSRLMIGGIVLLAIVVPCLFIWNAWLGRHGLTAQYYSDMNLMNFYKQQIVRRIDFNWGTGSPLNNWRKDEFSIRWIGFLEAPSDGNYDFYTHSDDGVRLWIDGALLIDNWTTHHVTVNRASIEMAKGYHPIKIEYYEKHLQAVLQLYWKPEFQPRPEIIPAKYLIPSREFLKPDVPFIGASSKESMPLPSNDEKP